MSKHLRTPDGHLYRITKIEGYPEGGGFATYWSDAHGLDDVTLLDQAPDPAWYQAQVEIDGLPGPWPAWLRRDQRWNGWVVPEFTPETADQIWAAFDGSTGDDSRYTTVGEGADRTWIYTYDEEEPEAFGLGTFEIAGQTRTLVSLGGMSWCWSIAEPEDDASESEALDVKHSTDPMADPTPLARMFCEGLHNVLTDQELHTIRHRNRHETEPGICHTHDFIDANLIMLAAWEHLDLPTRYGSPHPDHYSLWGSAWQTAMDWGFTPPTTP